ncbi:MAG: sugar ABC transporter ATP-binding protein [Melioribacteraceae bacterium]|nr:sugar ABC transporter ATP-binding protein [Melioribacteraceae bacterium]
MNKTNSNIILEARSITKAFSGIKALDKVNFEIEYGKVNALVGENGAGKSTLMKILSGVYSEYDGEIYLEGKKIVFNNPKDAQENGVSIIHQELNLIPYLSISENIFLGREFRTKFGFIDYAKLNKKASELLKKLHLDKSPKTLVSELRVGEQQVVEIAKALSVDSKVIIMDEPTSAISEHEVEVLFGIIRELRAAGVAIVYITHKLKNLFRIADNLTAFRDGKYVGKDDINNLSHDDIVKMMVGRDMDDYFVKSDSKKENVMLEIENVCLDHPNLPGRKLLNNISLKVKKGEVLGLFGLMGAGRTELFETIFGLHSKTSSGRIIIDEETRMIKSPIDAINNGLALVPEDRKENGLVLNMSVENSISLACISKIESYGFISKNKENKLANTYIKNLRIKTPSSEQKVEYLSGGNQQKVVIAKWLATEPKVLLLDEPTRGIDVNAKNEIYRLIAMLSDQGMAIIVVSSELPEIMSISDRVLVMAEGNLTGEFSYEEATEELIMKAAIPTSI